METRKSGSSQLRIQLWLCKLSNYNSYMIWRFSGTSFISWSISFVNYAWYVWTPSFYKCMLIHKNRPLSISFLCLSIESLPNLDWLIWNWLYSRISRSYWVYVFNIDTCLKLSLSLRYPIKCRKSCQLSALPFYWVQFLPLRCLWWCGSSLEKITPAWHNGWILVSSGWQPITRK